MKVKIKRIREGAIVPKYQTEGAACFDVHAVLNEENPKYKNTEMVWRGGHGLTTDDMYQSAIPCEPHILIPPMSQAIIPTGLVFQLPEGYYLDIRPRSGLAAKKCITITNSPGTLDEDYFDELYIILFNLSSENFMVKQGDRIAQCKVEKVERVEFDEVKELDTETIYRNRGGGLGSTGIR
jgi:dUTP pyrophosphatase